MLETLLCISDRLPAAKKRPQYRGYGICPDRKWITWDGRKVLWLPQRYRPIVSTVAGSHNCDRLRIRSFNSPWILAQRTCRLGYETRHLLKAQVPMGGFDDALFGSILAIPMSGSWYRCCSRKITTQYPGSSSKTLQQQTAAAAVLYRDVKTKKHALHCGGIYSWCFNTVTLHT